MVRPLQRERAQRRTPRDERVVLRLRQCVERRGDARSVESEPFAMRELDRGATVREVSIGEAARLEQDEERHGGSIDDASRTAIEHLELVAPIVDPPNEEVGSGIDRLDGQTERFGELHQRETFGRRSLEPHDVDVLGDASGLEPQRDEGASDEQPLTFEAITDRVHDRFEPCAVELERHGATVNRVNDAWKLIEAAGMPDGAPRAPGGRLDREELGRALAHVLDRIDELSVEHREPLLAWLRAFEHHWPERFHAELGSTGSRLSAALRSRSFDANRYLKLRRIAVENLAHLI